MLRICAWCGMYLGGDKSSDVITHGICDTCRDTLLKGKPKRKPRSTPAYRDAWSGTPDTDKHKEGV